MKALVWIGQGEVSVYFINDINFEQVLSDVDSMTEWYDEKVCVKEFGEIKNWNDLIKWVNNYPCESSDENFETFEIVEIQ